MSPCSALRSRWRARRRSRPNGVSSKSSASASSTARPARVRRGDLERAGASGVCPVSLLGAGVCSGRTWRRAIPLHVRVSSADHMACGTAAGRRYRSLGWKPARRRLSCWARPPSMERGTGPGHDCAKPRPRSAPNEPQVLHHMTSPDRISVCCTCVCSSALVVSLALLVQCCALSAVGMALTLCRLAPSVLATLRERLVA